MTYLHETVKQPYKQNTLIVDENNNVYKVRSCTDLGWLNEDSKGHYHLVAKFLYNKKSSDEVISTGKVD